MQLDLIPRTQTTIASGVVLIPNWLDVERQVSLLTLTKHWTKGLWGSPLLPNGTPIAHPLACLGYDWKPYQYHDIKKAMPLELILLGRQAIADAGLSGEFPTYDPETAVVNFFPHGSSLGQHQDKSEAQRVIDTGSPIVTVSLGDTGIFRLGNTQNDGKPYQDIELRSGDVIIMGGWNRLAFHGITKILPNTAPPEVAAKMTKPGRISITMREVKTTQLPPMLG